MLLPLPSLGFRAETNASANSMRPLTVFTNVFRFVRFLPAISGLRQPTITDNDLEALSSLVDLLCVRPVILSSKNQNAQTKVCNFGREFSSFYVLVDEYVFWFDVSVDHCNS